jgi:hypothetical protein
MFVSLLAVSGVGVLSPMRGICITEDNVHFVYSDISIAPLQCPTTQRPSITTTVLMLGHSLHAENLIYYAIWRMKFESTTIGLPTGFNLRF